VRFLIELPLQKVGGVQCTWWVMAFGLSPCPWGISYLWPTHDKLVLWPATFCINLAEVSVSGSPLFVQLAANLNYARDRRPDSGIPGAALRTPVNVVQVICDRKFIESAAFVQISGDTDGGYSIYGGISFKPLTFFAQKNKLANSFEMATNVYKNGKIYSLVFFTK